MVPDYAEYSLIIVDCLLGIKCDDYSCRCSSINSSFSFRERKDIFAVIYELERSGKITVIDDVEKSVGVTSYLNLSKVNGFV